MRRICFIAAITVLSVILLAGCTAQQAASSEEEISAATTEKTATAQKEDEEEPQTADDKSSEGEKTMRLLIGETEVPVTWENNDSVEALQDLCPRTIELSMYGGFEQVGSIGETLPSADQQTTTQAGDIVLYSSNQIVVFYGSNSWAYTRLGHIDLTQEEMESLLAGGDVSITLE